MFSRRWIVVFLGLANPKLNQYLIDEVLTLRDMDAVWTIIAGTVLLSLFSLVVGTVTDLASSQFSLRLDLDVTNLFYRHALGTSPQRSDSKDRVGDMASRMMETHNVTNFLTHEPLTIATNVVSLLMYAGILLTYDSQLAMLGLASLPIVLGVRLAYRPRLKRVYAKMFDLSRRNQSLITEQISNIATIKAAAAEEHMSRRLQENTIANSVARRKQQLESMAIDGIITTSMSVISTAALWVGVKAAAAGTISIGEVVAVNAYVGSLVGPCIALAGCFGSIEGFKVSLRRVMEKFSTRQDDNPSEALVKHNLPLRGKIRCDRIGFRYSEDTPWVLDDINLTIYPQQIVAIVGRSGCGKTTLANLIAGNLKPSTGRVFFDDFDSENLSVRCRRRQIGLIMQESRLFAGTIATNIAFADDSPSSEQIADAAVQAGAAGFVDGLPARYGFFLAEGGLGLSGGQKQRVSIARTLYRAPRIVIMDEATSALDAESESMIMRNMKDILKGRTAIIIAHRLSTVRYADRVIVLDEGRIVEDGIHASLLKKNGYYAQLFGSQIESGAA